VEQAVLFRRCANGRPLGRERVTIPSTGDTSPIVPPSSGARWSSTIPSYYCHY
jgi:hypothetical protein